MASAGAARRRGLCAAAVVALLLLHHTARAQLGPWIGGGGGAGGSGASLDDIATMFERFANMTPFQQQMVLMAAGLALQTRTGMDCNIFGGPTQCRAVPAQSSYVQQCGADAQPKVDCLFREATEANLYDSPVDNLEAYLKAKLAQQAQGMPMGRQGFDDVPALCPQCFERLQALWCALAVPSCGTFDVLVQRGILPALGQAVKAYRSRSSATRAEAVAGAVAAAVHVSGAGLPCAEMCEATLDTCGGNCEHVMSMAGGKVRQATLGALLQWMASRPEIRSIGRMPNLNNARAVFKDVWDRPLCSLFPRYNASDAAAGACRLPATVAQSQCKSQKEWCQATSMAAMAQGGEDHPVMYIQALILVQFLRASTGWLTTDDTIIFDIHSSVTDAAATTSVSGGADTDDMAAMAGGVARAGLSGGQIAGIVVLSLFAFALLSAGAAMVAMRWWRARGGRQQVWYAELSDQDGDTYPLNNPNNRL